jgi:ER lumen protein retaining receptor
MNIFRISADMLHIVSICLILLRILQQKTCAGLSKKTQMIYALVFTLRYLDLFTNFYSLYNTVLKVLFIASTYWILWLMTKDSTIANTYDHSNDNVRLEFIIAPCIALALFTCIDYSVMEVLWTISIYLEAVAVLPQLFLLQVIAPPSCSVHAVSNSLQNCLIPPGWFCRKPMNVSHFPAITLRA